MIQVLALVLLWEGDVTTVYQQIPRHRRGMFAAIGGPAA